MNIGQLYNLLQQYFTYIGIAYKFNKGEMFADLDIVGELKKLADQYQDGANFKDMIDCIQSWDGKFATLNIYQRALSDLTDKIIHKNISQNVVLKKWQRRSELKNEKPPVETKHGICGGLAYVSGLSIICDRVKNLPENIPASLLRDLEAVLAKISAWDGVKLSDDIEGCFRFLEEYALTIQRNQFAEFMAIKDKFPVETLPKQTLNLSFVHNAATLKHQFEEILRPGRFVLLSASHHAARIYVTEDHKIIYYNPNEKYGYLGFDMNHIEYLIEVLTQGFGNCYIDRFGLTTIVYDLQLQKTKPDLEKLQNELIKIKMDNNSATKQEVINESDSRGMTALNLACYENGEQQVSLLLAMGANPNISNVEGDKPIHYAARRGNVANLRSLLAQNTIMVNPVNHGGLTPLHCAINKSQHAVAKILIENPLIMPNQKSGKVFKISDLSELTPLMLAVFHNDVAMVKLLVANPDVKLNECEAKFNFTSLHVAVAGGRAEVIDVLLQQSSRFDINAISNETEDNYPMGMTALCYAVNNDKFEMAGKLLQAGAEIKYLCMSLRWELISHLYKDDISNRENYINFIIKNLASKDLVVDDADENCIQLFTDALENDDIELMELLVNANPNLLATMFGSQDETDAQSDDHSILHQAVLCGAVKCAQLCVKRDPALLSKKDSLGLTAADYLKVLTVDNANELKAILTPVSVTTVSVFPKLAEEKTTEKKPVSYRCNLI